jgi:hypothetical protein
MLTLLYVCRVNMKTAWLHNLLFYKQTILTNSAFISEYQSAMYSYKLYINKGITRVETNLMVFFLFVNSWKSLEFGPICPCPP